LQRHAAGRGKRHFDTVTFVLVVVVFVVFVVFILGRGGGRGRVLAAAVRRG
jgi:hypothetical protein